MSKLHLYLATCCLSLSLGSAEATVNIYIVTPEGIALGSDGQVLSVDGCDSKSPYKHGTEMKIVLLDRRVAVSQAGLNRLKTRDETTTLYDFRSWIRSEYHKLRPQRSVSQMEGIIEDESATAMAAVLADPQRFECFWPERPAIDGVQSPSILSQYIVAGYEAGVPVVGSVEVNIDWKKGTITTHRIDLQSVKGGSIKSGNRGAGGIGLNEVVCAVCRPGNEYYKRSMTKFPTETERFCRRGGAHISLQQASDMARILIEIDAGINPYSVGFPITIATIPRAGKAEIRSYCRPFPSTPDRLTEKHGCTEK